MYSLTSNGTVFKRKHDVSESENRPLFS